MSRLISCITIIIVSGMLFSCDSAAVNVEEKDAFCFIFMTDIHLQPEKEATQGFLQAIDTVNKINPDFVLTGGDLVMDVLDEKYSRADSLYNLYNQTIKNFKMPVYNTIGNHELFGIYHESGVDTTHPEYRYKMYEKRIGKTYYSFDHQNWHFMVLNSVEDTREDRYIGMIDELQMEWIRKDLEKIDKNTPIAISTHIPFLTTFLQALEGPLTQNGPNLVVNNSKEVLELFEGYKLKLVLQGHTHIVEDIFINDIHFLTGGAVSARWWSGPNRGMEEGFMLIHVEGEDFEWEYIDYGWKVDEAYLEKN